MSSSTSSEVVVRARHLGKAYQLYARRSDWLKQVMLGWWKSYFKPFWVLRDIDLDVYRGDSIGILGRNGCGKSTLLQVICGMTLPSNGELRVTGRIAPVLALGATFDTELSGRENIMIGGAVLGLKRPEVLRKFDSICEFAGIGDYMEQPVKHYSMGMKTRLAFAICAHVDAEILVVDEAARRGRRRLPAQVPRLDRRLPQDRHVAVRFALDFRGAPAVQSGDLDRGGPHSCPGRAEHGDSRLPPGDGDGER